MNYGPRRKAGESRNFLNGIWFKHQPNLVHHHLSSLFYKSVCCYSVVGWCREKSKSPPSDIDFYPLESSLSDRTRRSCITRERDWIKELSSDDEVIYLLCNCFLRIRTEERNELWSSSEYFFIDGNETYTQTHTRILRRRETSESFI